MTNERPRSALQAILHLYASLHQACRTPGYRLAYPLGNV